MDQKQDFQDDENPSETADRLEVRNGKTLLKLKLPKMEATAAAEDGGESKKHTCHECGRSFSSGKALGGHMSSAHVQASKDQSVNKLKSKTAAAKIGRRDTGASEAEFVCKECGRSFPTRKALFGHMRCHPERSYRGMNSSVKLKIGSDSRRIDPPSDLGIEGEGETQSGPPDANRSRMDGLDSVMKPSKSWSVTGKRGRGQLIKPSPSSVSVSSTAEEEEVFHALIMLHRGDGHRKSQPSYEEEVKDNSSHLGEGFQIRKDKKKRRISEENNQSDTIDEAEAESEAQPEINQSDSSPINNSDEICLSAMADLMKQEPITTNPNQNEELGTTRIVNAADDDEQQQTERRRLELDLNKMPAQDEEDDQGKRV